MSPATDAESTEKVRLYGGWRLRRGIGLWGLDAPSTALVLGCVLTPMLLAAVNPRAGFISAVPAALMVVTVATRVDGVALGVLARRRLRWTAAIRAGRRSRRYGANAVGAPPRWPAPLGSLQLLEASGGRGDFGVVRDLDRGLVTVTLRCAASSAWLVERDQADAWVGAWHQWLASLGYAPTVRWVNVVVQTAPEPGTALRDSVDARVDAAAPADARSLLRQLVVRSPAAAAQVSTWVAVTIDPSRLEGARAVRAARTSRAARSGDQTEQLAEVDRLISGLESSLAGCGVTVLGRASATEVLDVVADAFDPASRGHRSALLPATRRTPTRVRSWTDAAPVAVEEEWDQMRHDSGVSVSWGWREAPRQQVSSEVLARLHSPGRYPKRVALLFRPMPAVEAARLLESEVNAAAFRDAYRRAQRRDETARDVADREQARRAAREEALGAGVVLVSVYATVTVTDRATLADAVADVESRAEQSRIRLRRLYGGQAIGFAASLPLGLHPAVLAGRRTTQGRRARRNDHPRRSQR